MRGTRNEYHRIEAEDYLLVEGLHEAIVSEDLWQAAQTKAKKQAKRYEHAFGKENQRVHLLSGILRCPVCGAPMYGNKCIKHKPDGTKYKDFFYYGCKHRLMTKGNKCDYRRMVNEEMLDSAVVEVITQLVSRPKFAAMMSERINTKIDTTEIDQEISTAEKELRHSFTLKAKLIEEIDSLDFDDRHYNKRKADLGERLYGVYDSIDQLELDLEAAREKKSVLEADKMTSENIYRILINFEQLYAIMDEGERRKLMETLIAEIQIHEEAKRTVSG